MVTGSRLSLTLVIIFIGSGTTAQDLGLTAARILNEGIALYRNERASWISADAIPPNERPLISGYCTYPQGQNFVSIYFDDAKRAKYKFTFSPTDSLGILLISTERDVQLTEEELIILKVRETAHTMATFWYQQFGYSPMVNPNVIIHQTSPGFVVYAIAGAKQPGLLPIGGDLLFTFKASGKLDKMDAIHNNLLPFEIDAPKGKVKAMMHEHRGGRLEKEFITPTDICALLLYREHLEGEKHVVVHRRFISEFYLNALRLMIRPNTEKLKLH